MLSLKKHPLFDCDLETAALWYGQRNPAIAERLIDDAALTIRTIMADPLRFSVWAGETRRIRLRRFPYLVFYEFRHETVYLLALTHGARDLPSLMKERRSSG